jgi:muramoyltetrapeptide carboxypeptidase
MVKVEAMAERGLAGRSGDGAVAMVWPPPVAPGDVIAVVAPSSPFDVALFERGVAWLRERYRVKLAADVLDRQGYLAGEDARRARELAAAVADPDVKAIVAARGGYGAMRILDAIPWGALAAVPRWIVGFSDVTALHACAWAHGVASIHGPNATGLGNPDASPDVGAAWIRALEAPRADAAWEGLTVLHRGAGGAGRATGRLVGGNLSLVMAMAAGGRLALPDACVLALEDVTERPYRVDRMLTALRLGGHLQRAGAIVFGSFDQCDPGPDGVTVAEVLAASTHDLGVPVLADAPFGHASPNLAFILGSMADVTTEGRGAVRMRCPPGDGR